MKPQYRPIMCDAERDIRERERDRKREREWGRERGREGGRERAILIIIMIIIAETTRDCVIPPPPMSSAAVAVRQAWMMILSCNQTFLTKTSFVPHWPVPPPPFYWSKQLSCVSEEVVNTGYMAGFVAPFMAGSVGGKLNVPYRAHLTPNWLLNLFAGDHSVETKPSVI